MNKIDLIIDALEYSVPKFDMKNQDANWERHNKALVAALELKALKPVGYMDSKGVLFNHTTHPHLNTPLYALDGEQA